MQGGKEKRLSYMKCANCGTELKDGTLFCPACKSEVQWVPEYHTLETILLQKQMREKSLKEKKQKKEEELRRFIIEDLHSGATVYESYGAYNMEKHREIITIVDKAEYQRLMNFMNREDPQAFITVYTVSDIRYQPKA